MPTTPQSALRYTSGVALYEKNDNRFDINLARGFDLDDYLDGMGLLSGSFAIPRIDPYFLERIEVLKGPASVLYGQAPPGGLVNPVSKRPTLGPFHEILFQTGSYDRLQGAFDFSGPTGEIRSRGIELEGHASLTAGLNLTAAYTYLDAEVTKSNDIDRGKRPATIPSHLASLWGDYTIQGGTLSGLGFGAGVR